MALSSNIALRNAFLDGALSNFNSGVLEIYDGTPPADADASVGAQVILATINLPASAFNSAAAAAAALSAAVSDVSADATGTATWFRMRNGAGTIIIQGTVGTSGADMIVDNDSFQIGGQINITAMTINHP